MHVLDLLNGKCREQSAETLCRVINYVRFLTNLMVSAKE